VRPDAAPPNCLDAAAEGRYKPLKVKERMSSAVTDAPVRVGEIVAGKYRVERVLGAGAMGVVVAAMHVDLDERRAIKFMRPSSLGEAANAERFLREARAMARLKSEHVAKIHDVGRLTDGKPYIVMEYLDGADLKSTLEGRGKLPPAEAVHYLLQACEAIAEAHALGIIHRDLKLANLFLTHRVGGKPWIKVLDFGIAKIADDQEQLHMTGTSAMLGTPFYMSPEQMRSTKNVDARTDIWSLGVMLYRMLTGMMPFPGSNITEICASIMADQPSLPAMLEPQILPGLEAAVMRCLEKNPAQRFGSVSELMAALSPFAAEWEPSAKAVDSEPPAAPAVAPPAPVGQTTAQGASWSRPEPTATSRSASGAVVGVTIAALSLLGVGAFIGSRLPGPSSATLGTASSLTAVAEPAASPDLAAAPSTRAAPAVLVVPAPEPSASASALAMASSRSPVATARRMPVARPPDRNRPSTSRKADAFGSDRK
jgi:serine/threonine-protein kinase